MWSFTGPLPVTIWLNTASTKSWVSKGFPIIPKCVGRVRIENIMIVPESDIKSPHKRLFLRSPTSIPPSRLVNRGATMPKLLGIQPRYADRYNEANIRPVAEDTATISTISNNKDFFLSLNNWLSPRLAPVGESTFISLDFVVLLD